MSKTPETDEAIVAYRQRNWGNGGMGKAPEPKAVHASFAARLEADRDNWKKLALEYADEICELRHQIDSSRCYDELIDKH